MAVEALIIELTGSFSIDAADKLSAESNQEEVHIGVGSGLGAERVLKFVSDLSKPAIETSSRLVRNAIQANRVTGIRISRSGVEIDSMRVEDTEQMLAFVEKVMARLDEA